MEHINTFSGGMNKDLAKSLFKQGNYIHAENFSLITDTGLSTGTLRNTNGHVQYFQIPDTSDVYELTPANNTTFPTSVSIIINSVTYIYTGQSSIESLGAAMQADTTLAAAGFLVAYSDTRVIIYSNYNGLTPNTDFPVNKFFTVVSLSSVVVTQILSAVTAPKIIGWGVIRDQVILYTTDNSLSAPVNQVGQIWLMSYDKYLFNVNFKLVYNNLINFSLAHPIPNPGGFIGNFETPGVQKIYWSDNYNRPRTLNIADPNAMALTPALLDLNTDISLAVATVNEVLIGGSIKTGVYQISARLTNTSGATTAFVLPSNPLPVIAEPESPSEAFSQYEARDTGITVAKSLKGKLFNLDTKYDRIEPVILYRENPNVVPDIYILPSQPIPNNGEFQFYYTGGETTIPISLEEFLVSNVIFDTVKSLTTKNNILFFGNVKYTDFDVDFDARAYRFNANRQALINSNSGTSITLSAPNPAWTSVPDTHDAIQNIDSQAPNNRNNYLFQSNGTTFGGEGLNVKYEFEPIQNGGWNDTSINSQYKTLLDDRHNNNNTMYQFVPVNYHKSPDTNIRVPYKRVRIPSHMRYMWEQNF